MQDYNNILADYINIARMREENNIPVFFMREDDTVEVYETQEFYDNILDFIEGNLNGTLDEHVLCHVITDDGTTMVAELYPDAYGQSLSKSLEFFISNENYEKCKIVKELIEKI